MYHHCRKGCTVSCSETFEFNGICATLQLLSRSQVIHSCYGARYLVIEGLITERIEQENVVRRAVTFNHKLQSQIFIECY